MAGRISLVSCVKSKLKSPAPAQDLYVSTLFKSMKRYALENTDGWFILSAEHGLLRPSQIIAPYERTLKTMPKRDRVEWAERVQRQLLEVLPASATVVILAGEDYRGGLVPFLNKHGFIIEVPMKGLKFGPQLRWLKEHFRNG